MADTRTPQTVDDYPGLFYHQVTDGGTLADMETVRAAYIELGRLVLARCRQDRYRSLAMTALEESLRCAIASLAVEDPDAKRLPTA